MTKKLKLFEDDIKALLIEHLKQKKHLSKEDVLISEFTIDDHTNRADLVIAEQDKFHAFEIKSEADSLTRLPAQVEKYLEFFDKVTVIAASKHVAKVTQLVPNEAVSIWEVSSFGFKIIRRGKSQKKQSSLSLLKLMTAKELYKFAKEKEFSGALAVEGLNGMLSVPPYNEVRFAVISAILYRYKSATNHFWGKVGSGSVTPSHLKSLSPFLVDKRRIQESTYQQASFWQEWCKKSQSLLEKISEPSRGEEEASISFGQIPISIQKMLNA